MSNICIGTYGTVGYLYAFRTMISRVITAALHHKHAHFIFATDESKESKEAVNFLKEELK